MLSAGVCCGALGVRLAAFAKFGVSARCDLSSGLRVILWVVI
jgi:hypothetical protein